MRQHQTVKFLHHADGPLAAKNGAFHLVCLALVDGKFLLPSHMIQLHQRLGGVLVFIQQRGDQTMFLLITSTGLFIKDVVDDTHHDPVGLLPSILVVFVKTGQIRSVALHLDRFEDAVDLPAGQKLGFLTHDLADQIEAGEAAIL